MRKLLLLLAVLLPTLIMAQADVKNGTVNYDYGKKKHKQQDTTAAPIQNDDEDEESTPAPKKVKKVTTKKTYNWYTYDFKTEGVFKGTFNAGLNACQVDGDNEWGYRYFGAEFGAGTIARVHRFLSLSLEIDYSMKGARARISTIENPNYYRLAWDYVQVPVALNAHYRDIIMVCAGLSPAYMVRYKEFNNQGINVTADPVPLGQPHKFDLGIFAQVYYVIKKHYAIGFKYSYSLLKIREPLSYTKVNGQYNNVLNLRFMYILGPVKKKH